MDNQVIGYKDLAAIPKDKAILDIERPDLMMYQPHFNYSPMDRSEVQHTHIRYNRIISEEQLKIISLYFIATQSHGSLWHSHEI